MLLQVMNIDSNKKEDVGLMPMPKGPAKIEKKGPDAGHVAGAVAGAALGAALLYKAGTTGPAQKKQKIATATAYSAFKSKSGMGAGFFN